MTFRRLYVVSLPFGPLKVHLFHHHHHQHLVLVMLSKYLCLYSLYGQSFITSYDINRYLLCTNNSKWSCPLGQSYNGSVCQNEYNITSSTPNNQQQCANNQTMYWNGSHCVSSKNNIIFFVPDFTLVTYDTEGLGNN